MSPGQLPSDSIKVVPGRSKLRVESSNPVARGNPIPRASKVKLLSPEEAMKLTSGGNGMAVSPVKPARATSQVPKPVPPRRTPEAPRPVPACPTPEAPRPVSARPTSEAPTPETPRPVSARPTSAAPSPVSARRTPEAPRPIPARPTSEAPTLVPALPTSAAPSPVSAHPTSAAPSPVSAHPTSAAPSPVSARQTSEASKPVLANPAAGIRREIVCGLRALSMTTTPVRQRTNPSLLQSKKVEPPSPRALQIRSRVKQQAANATQVQQGTIVEVGGKAKDHGSKEIRQSVSEEELSELLLYLPAQNPTWNGRIMDSASPPEFDCEFWSKPASNITRKALRRSKAMPALLKVELLPTCHILNDVSGRSPTLLKVEMYLFPDEKKTERFKGEHANLFEAMATRNVMAKANINDTELLIFSSKLLDKTSQFVINTQKKTENFLWGFFLQTKNSLGLVPETASQIDTDFDDGDVVDMDIDTECLTPSLALKLITESQNTPSRSPEKVNRETSLPPGFEKIWTPPLVKLNIQGTSNPLSDLTGSAGIVRDQSGKWVFGYIRCHRSIPEVAAGLLAIYHGLKFLWDSGFRRIQLETTSFEIINALTTRSSLFCKRKTLLGSCKDMILKDWECDIYHISKEQNSCAEWLAKRSEEQPQDLVFFEYPPRGLVDLLEKDRLAAM
ncbi:Ribonuclease H-like superfamily [Arabidopsis suecica]|uniref:Ribonuclease H-like superfamily n=1 Tax=Arabidopsis suecica TaxID=45249 RepID=A0A8T1Y1T4_ARASU|nr:Ribonuclease H-like superfamily [Arabidopsis suecica]